MLSFGIVSLFLYRVRDDWTFYVKWILLFHEKRDKI